MQITTEGIVLRQRKIANNRRMIVIFTKRYGKISAGTSINEKSRNKSALALRPFTFSEYDIFKGRDSYSINSASVLKSYYSIGEDIDRFMTASVFISFLDSVLQDEVPAAGIYDLSLQFLESVSKATGTYETLLYAFIIRTLPVLGVMPELKTCVNCGKPVSEFGSDQGSGKVNRLFSVTSGGVICEDCANREKTEGNALIYSPAFDIIDVFRFFVSRPLSTFEKISLKPGVNETIRSILADYLSRYLGTDVLYEGAVI
jgi:DNA repair protein RecO (recombination protein O)